MTALDPDLQRRLSVVVPAFNEEDGIVASLQAEPFPRPEGRGAAVSGTHNCAPRQE